MSLAASAPPPSGQSQTQGPAEARLGDAFQPAKGESQGEEKKKKRSLFGFGKKKTDDQSASATQSSSRTNASNPDARTTAETRKPTSPIQTASSTSRALSSSPRLTSPAGSQIFERDVQDSTVHMPNSPAIPAHIQTENHIPPVLDASSEAITDEKIDPDSVEIITHSQHQPAAVTVTGVVSTGSDTNVASSWADELITFNSDREDSGSNYGSFDTTDVRRLSFISFADVVQAEHGTSVGAAGSRESIHIPGMTSLASMGVNRSPSPIRSPVSSQGALDTSPPTSKDPSMKGFEMSPSRRPLGSPTSSTMHHNLGVSGEVNIETMSQALRRTGSADLSGVLSQPTSPIEGGPSR